MKRNTQFLLMRDISNEKLINSLNKCISEVRSLGCKTNDVSIIKLIKRLKKINIPHFKTLENYVFSFQRSASNYIFITIKVEDMD